MSTENDMSNDEKALQKERGKRHNKKTEFSDREKRPKRLPSEMRPKRQSGHNFLREVKDFMDRREEDEE